MNTPDPSESTSAKISFALTPQVAFMVGVSYKAGTLRFGPSGSARVSAVGQAIIGSLVATGFVLVSTMKQATFNGYPIVHPLPVRLMGIVFGGLGWAWAWWVFRTGVVADSNGLHLQSRRRRATFSWAEIAGIGTFLEGGGTARLLVAPSSLTLRSGDLPQTVGFVRTQDGNSMSLPGVHSIERSAGLTLGDLTSADMKVALLLRFAQVAAGRTFDHAAAPDTLQRLKPSKVGREVFESFAGVASVYGLTSWSAGRWIHPAFPLIGFVACLFHAFRKVPVTRE